MNYALRAYESGADAPHKLHWLRQCTKFALRAHESAAGAAHEGGMMRGWRHACLTLPVACDTTGAMAKVYTTTQKAGLWSTIGVGALFIIGGAGLFIATNCSNEKVDGGYAAYV